VPAYTPFVHPYGFNTSARVVALLHSPATIASLRMGTSKRIDAHCRTAPQRAHTAV
jgi:hypothetical protein